MDILLDQIIKEGIKQKIPESLNNMQYFTKMQHSRSYSPQINKYLVSISNSPAHQFSLCDRSLLTINIGSETKPYCVKYTDQKAREFFLKNLKNREINCSQVIAPKQINANCWFNTFFITFFISDKGRKFFKFFRQLMIEGKFANGKQIPEDLAKAFFLLNIAIEASYNHLLNDISYILNTNFLIKDIYNAINISHKIQDKKFRDIEKLGDAGNPLKYYLAIMKYLNISPLDIKIGEVYSNDQLERINNLKINDTNNNFPDILILEIPQLGRKKINKKKAEIIITIGDKSVKYILDAAVILDNDDDHFCSTLTCNGEEYIFEGGSYNRFYPFKWKKLLNKNHNWSFTTYKADWSYNFTKGGQMLFYYRI